MLTSLLSYIADRMMVVILVTVVVGCLLLITTGTIAILKIFYGKEYDTWKNAFIWSAYITSSLTLILSILIIIF